MFAKYSVRKPFTVLVAVLLIIVLGVISVTNMTPNLLPDMSFPYVMIYTVYPGASPEEVELVVTKPIEQAMSTLSNVKSITSTSGENYSLVSIEFNNEVNMDAITIDIREGLNAVAPYWDEYVQSPTILKLSPNIIPTTVSAVHYEGKNTVELSNFINDTLMTELEGVDGVATIVKTGLLTQTLNITIDEDKLDAMNDKIYAAIDERFAAASTELDDARKQLADGQKELEDNQALLEQGQKELDEGRQQAKGEFADAQRTLDQTNAELAQLSADLTQQRGLLVTQLDTVMAAQQQLTELLPTVVLLETAENVLDASIRVIEQNDLLTEEQKAEYTAAIINSDEYKRVKEGLASIDAQLNQFGLARDGIADKIVELRNLQPQLEDGIAQIDKALADLEAGRLELEEGYALLDDKKHEVYGALNAAQTQIQDGYDALDAAKLQMEAGQTQLTEAEKLADEQLQAAYKMADLHGILSIETVSSIISAQNFSMPAGYVMSDDGQWLVQIGDKLTELANIEQLVLFSTGLEGMEPVLIGDVATVELTDNSDTTFARINDSDGVLLSFTQQSTYAAATVAGGIKDKMDELEQKYEGLKFTRLFDQGDYINMAIGTVVQNLLLGGILAILILLIFLRDIRPTFIVACSIPISVLFALVLMYFSGVTINLISMAGLAVGIGMLVDNSIVVIENIYRMRSLGIPVKQAAIEGAKEVTGAITASTLTTVCVFAPIVFISGITRQLFTDMALTITYSLMASLIVAITLVPAAARGVLRKAVKPQKDRTKRLLDKYEKVIRFCLGHRILCIGAAVLLLAGSMFLSLAKGFAYMPESGGTQISVEAQLPDDTPYEDAKAFAEDMLQRMYKIDGLTDVGGILSNGGVASLIGLTDSSGAGTPTTITIYALMDENGHVSSSQMSARIKEAMGELKDKAEITVAGMSTIDSASFFGGDGIVLNIYGTDLDAIHQSAQLAVEAIKGVEGVEKIDDGMVQTSSALHITVDKNAAMEHNLTTAQVYLAINEQLTTAKTATTVNTNDSTITVNVISAKNSALTKTDIYLMELTATKADGTTEQVPLRGIASFEQTETLQAISRENQRRYVSVTAAVADGYNVTKVTDKVYDAIAKVEFAKGVTYEFEGENETIVSALRDLVFMLAIGVLMIYLIMVAQFQSLLSPFIVMFTLPLAFTGGFLALLIAGMEVSVVSMIGFIMLIGIIVNNGIVLVDCINRLRRSGMDKRDAIVAAERTRLRPVLMTALTTILGLLPLALGIGTGAEIVQPVAVVCIGGLTYATLTTLLIIPVMYDIFTRNKKYIPEPAEQTEAAE